MMACCVCVLVVCGVVGGVMAWWYAVVGVLVVGGVVGGVMAWYYAVVCVLVVCDAVAWCDA